MRELNDEIKLTLNLMQSDIDDGAHGELQWHLYSLLEIKRNELQQRLVERTWVEPVTHDEAKPLTTEELMAGGWWCADVSEECRLALVSVGVDTDTDNWYYTARVRYAFKPCPISSVIRATFQIDGLKEIHRIGNEFYWSEK